MAPREKNTKKNDMLPQYSFKDGMRGKHAAAYREGHTVEVCREDGTHLVMHYTLEDGAILLAPDVRKYFPDSESVNKTLRGLIELTPKKRRANP